LAPVKSTLELTVVVVALLHVFVGYRGILAEAVDSVVGHFVFEADRNGLLNSTHEHIFDHYVPHRIWWSFLLICQRLYGCVECLRLNIWT